MSAQERTDAKKAVSYKPVDGLRQPWSNPERAAKMAMSAQREPRGSGRANRFRRCASSKTPTMRARRTRSSTTTSTTTISFDRTTRASHVKRTCIEEILGCRNKDMKFQKFSKQTTCVRSLSSLGWLLSTIEAAAHPVWAFRRQLDHCTTSSQTRDDLVPVARTTNRASAQDDGSDRPREYLASPWNGTGNKVRREDPSILVRVSSHSSIQPTIRCY